jgi:hypothetical protein
MRRDHLEDVGAGGRMILKWILRENVDWIQVTHSIVA